jgi:pepF/M3 family oligoendopeptidase
MTWDLKSLHFYENLPTSLDALEKKIEKLSFTHAFKESLRAFFEIMNEMRELDALTTCVFSEDQSNETAKKHFSKMTSLYAAFEILSLSLDDALLGLTDEHFDDALKDYPEGMAYILEKRKRLRKKKLSKPYEDLIQNLSTDGFHSWYTLYEELKSHLRVFFDGSILTYSEAENLLDSPKKEVRHEAFKALSLAFEEQADLFATTLNSLSGFRLACAKMRHQSILEEPLEQNHCKASTLDSLFHEIEKIGPTLFKSLHHKAHLLGETTLNYVDVEAPFANDSRTFSTTLGYDHIIKAFKHYSGAMSAHAKEVETRAFADLEMRKNKRAGGFCVSFPMSKSSRILMNYENTFDNVITLAHEIGHSFHAECTFNLPVALQDYPMNLAETASTLGEAILLDYFEQSAKTTDEKKSILGQKIASHFAYLCNLPMRFHFEKAFYEQRQEGPLSPTELSHLMKAAQEKAYFGALSSYHPFFWASKMHFYFTNISFYNFPYTMGYLTSLSLFELWKNEKNSFEKRVINFLKDTGQMDYEQLIFKHFKMDPQAFFSHGISRVKRELESFIQLKP